MNNPIINIQGVNINQSNKHIFKNITLQISKGDFLYIIGETGSGKSSLLKTLYAEIKVSAGNVLVSNMNLTKIKHKNKQNEVRYRLTLASQACLTNCPVGPHRVGGAAPPRVPCRGIHAFGPVDGPPRRSSSSVSDRPLSKPRHRISTAHSSKERRRPLFWQPFSAVTEPAPGLLVPLSGILASRRRKPRKNEKKRGKNGRDMA